MAFRLILNSVLLSALACTAQAQQQQPAPQQEPAQQQHAASPMPAVPPPTCVKPEYPQKFADQRRFDRFNKESKAYTDCVKKYIADTKALSDAAIAAGQALIDEYNALTADYNARQQAK